MHRSSEPYGSSVVYVRGTATSLLKAELNFAFQFSEHLLAALYSCRLDDS